MLVGVLAIFTTPTDIFPNINIPVVSIIWNYQGLTAEDMGNRIYLTVTTAQSASLTNQVTAINILGRRISGAVLLIQALGGGWNASTLKS